MITRIKRLRKTKEQIIMKEMKYKVAHGVPHVRLGIQSDPVLVRSNMIRFQSSPVDIRKRRTMAYPKLLKLVYSSITTPSVTSLKRKVPRTAKIKKISISREKTLKSAGRENCIVSSKAYSPLNLLTSLKSLDTRKTLRTLAS